MWKNCRRFFLLMDFPTIFPCKMTKISNCWFLTRSSLTFDKDLGENCPSQETNWTYIEPIVCQVC